MYAAILLAAGQSSRMGQTKGLLEWNGQPLIVHQLAQIKKSRISRIIVVLGHKPEQYHPWIEPGDSQMSIVQNENWQGGKSSSIRKGLSAIEERCRAILFVNVDQPVTAPIIDALLDSCERTQALIHIPVWNGRRGHPVLFSSLLLTALKHVKEEAQGLKSIIRGHADQVADVMLDDPSILYNFNTIQDYEGRKPI